MSLLFVSTFFKCTQKRNGEESSCSGPHRDARECTPDRTHPTKWETDLLEPGKKNLAGKKEGKLSACRGEGSAAGLACSCACALCLLRCWLCYGLHWLSSVFLELGIGNKISLGFYCLHCVRDKCPTCSARETPCL
jgi:hypothetical protein